MNPDTNHYSTFLLHSDMQFETENIKKLKREQEGYKKASLSKTYFTKINSKTIINIKSVTGYSLGGNIDCFFLVGDKFYFISHYFLRQAKELYRNYLSSQIDAEKTPKEVESSLLNIEGQFKPKAKAMYLSKSDMCKSNIDFGDIIYLTRKETLTTVYFEGGFVKHFYEPLQYFETFFGIDSTFIRIRRNCIINLKFMDYYQANPSNKTGEIMVGPQTFIVSRRLVPLFNKKLKLIVKK